MAFTEPQAALIIVAGHKKASFAQLWTEKASSPSKRCFVTSYGTAI
jgi:hypothetical protein